MADKDTDPHRADTETASPGLTRTRFSESLTRTRVLTGPGGFILGDPAGSCGRVVMSGAVGGMCVHRSPGSTWFRKRGAIFQEMSMGAAGWELVCLSALWSSLLRRHCSQIGRTNLWASWGWEHFELMWRSVKTGNGHPWQPPHPLHVVAGGSPLHSLPRGTKDVAVLKSIPAGPRQPGERARVVQLSVLCRWKAPLSGSSTVHQTRLNKYVRFLLQDPLSRLHVCLLCLRRAL